ncbi:T9SS type A sorting domain-containing protein [Ekhidna sp.]|uniref:T9SS type A sorting domain-containing protein n=1 Tax=Ekhidna sp. TaxID=2608089 RepID=UPI003B5B928D
MKLKGTLFLIGNLCLLISVIAQNNPAGVGSNNIIWLEANDLSGPLSDNFTWSDKTANGFDAVEVAGGSVPTIVTISGNQYLRFAGSAGEQLLIADDDATTNLLDGASEFSVIVVFNTGSTDTRALISKRLNSGGGSRSWTMFYNSGFNMFGYAGATTVGGSGNVASAGNPYIATMTVDASLSGGSVKMFVNTDSEGSTGSNVSIPDRTEDILIGEFNNGDGRYFDGDIAEIIVYRDALNGGERIVLENYLADKYGISISADYFGNYANYTSTYNDDMRGIGTEDGSEIHGTSGFSSGLQIEATSGLDNSDEFVLFAHDNAVAHADNSTANTADVDIFNRWQKDYFVEASQSGVIDAASVETTFRFDFGDAGLTRTGSVTDYVLLYRSTSTGEFSRVFANSYAFENGDQVAVSVPASRLRSGYYTLGRGNQITSRTWYVLQNGNWSNPNTWTLDAGSAPIPNNPLNETPGNEDEVVIRNGKTVTIQSTTNNLSLSSITIDGILNLTTSSSHDFSIINGQGTIRMSGNGGVSNFPDGVTTTSDGFGNPANGGLLIVEDALEFDQSETFKDVRILTDAATDIVALGANLTINGDFNVRFGTLQFGDGTTANRAFTVIGDFSVENNGGSQDGRVSTAVASNTRHEFNLYGDFLNEGTAQFSDRTTPTYGSESTNGVVDLNLISTTQSQRVDCNGLTYFYRIEIDKGSTDFVADIQADDPGNFILTGFANDNVDGDVDDPSDNDNAFALITGSASIGTNVSIRLNTTGNYSIGTGAKLIVNGGEVTKTGGAAITPYGTIEVAAGILEVPSGSGITTRDAGQIIVSGGEVWASQIRTSIQGSIAQGGFQQTGGTVNVWDYSAAESPILGLAAGSPNGTYARFCLTYEGNSFIMTGGTLNVKDDTGVGLIFINSDASNINVSGGQVNAYSSTTGNSIIASRAPFWNLNIINEDPGTGGRISSETATCGSGGADDRTITDPDLKVLNDLTIETSTTRTSGSNTYGAYLDLCPLNNCVNLEVGGDLMIEDSGVLDVWAWDGSDNDGSATVTMNGDENSMLYVGDITTYTNALVEFEYPGAGPWPSGFGSGDETYGIYTLPFYNWVIDKDDAILYLAAKLPSKGDGSPGGTASLYKTSNGGKNLSRYAQRLIVVTNEFQLLNGTLNQVDPLSTLQLTEGDGTEFGTVGDPVAYGMYLLGTITNQGNCFVYEDGVTRKEGTVNIRASNNVTISSTDGATFGNLEINNAGFEITLTSDLEVGRLQYAAGIIDIGTHNLKVDVFEFLDLSSSGFIPEVGGQGVYSTADYIRMAGNVSDGGLSIKLPRSLTLYESSTPSFPDANYTEEYNIVDRASYYVDGQVYNTPDRLWFPIGTDANAVERYTPAVMHVVDDASVTYDGDEYVTVRIADSELQTTDLAGGDILSYYWNVSMEGFDGGVPDVSWIFQYDDADVDAGDETLYVPGKVEDAGNYLRYDDGTDQAVKDGGAAGNNGNIVGTDPANIIMFNGVNTDAVGDDANDEIDTGTGDGVYNQGNVDNNWTTPWPGAGFPLENANYTAGESTRFDGAPTIFYSRESGSNADWDEGASWNSEVEIAADPVGSPGVTDEYDSGVDQIAGNTEGVDYPGPGDIALLGVNPDNGTPHSIRIERGITASAAEFRFVINATITQAGRGGYAFLPELTLNSDGGIPTIALSQIKGVGVITDRNNTDPDLSSVDLGDYIDESESFYLLENFDPTFTYQNIPSRFPNLIVTSDGFGNNDRTTVIGADIEVEGDLIVAGDANLELNDDIGNPNDGDIIVNGDFLVTASYEVFPGTDIGTVNERPELIFPGSTSGVIPSRTIEVGGDLILNFGEARAYIANSGSNDVNHTLIIHGNLADSSVVDNSGFDFYENTDRVNLVFEGTSSSAFTRGNTNAGSVPDLYSIQLNKVDTTTKFTINTEFTIPLPATISQQPIEIVNGLLVLDNAAIDVTLTDETRGNFLLPNTLNSDASSGSGGLEIANGIVRLGGDDTGIILDGLLRISGGTLDMSDDSGDNGNNFIQYGSSDEAVIEVTAGSLLVGSQVRRALTSMTGLLNYSQTGGIAQFGITAAPENTRGVFELLGSGSEFTHTGGEFTVVRENGSATVGSLIIKPNGGDIDVSGSIITIGSADTPANQDDIGIDANVPLGNVLVTGNNNLAAKIYNVQLGLGDLTIQAGGTFDANGFDLTINGDFANDGTYSSGGTDINQQTTSFPTVSPQAISGTGTTNFFNLEKDGTDVLTVGKDLTIDNDLTILDGTVSTGTSAVNVKGDMQHDAIHVSDPTGPGIVFNGSDLQNLDTSTGTAEFGVLTLDNSNGLEIPGDGRIFEVNNKVVLSSGVFNIGGNLLIMDEDAVFENGVGGQARVDFNVNSMISVNASITDNGVRKIFTDDFSGTYLYPVGLNYYTPAEVNITDLTGSIGDDNQITIKPIEDIAGGIPDDADEVCDSFTQDYVDVDNILQFYWSIRSENIEDFDGSIFLYHVDELEAFDNTESLDLTNYAPARLLNASSSWDKGYGADQFDETNNVIEFRLIGGGDYTGFTSTDIAGTYTAGIYVESESNTPLCGGAIPDVVPEYVTLSTSSSGDVDQGGSFVGGVPPSLGESPDLRVAGDFTLNLTSAIWRFRKVTIETGATLTVSGAGVNLGTVEGDGTLKLINTNALPAGDYASFEADAGCTTGGGFEMEVITGNSVDLTLPFSRLRRLILSGDGEKVITNGTTLNICENLEILNDGTLTMGDNTTLNVRGNIIKAATATFDGDFSDARIVMEGSSIQQIDGDFTGLEAIMSLEVDNAAGLTVLNGSDDNVDIEDLIMTNGKIFTDDNNSLIILSTGSVTGNFSNTTFVDGPLVRRLETSTDRQFFPVGDGTVYLPFEVSNTQGYVGTKDWTVRYHDADPGSNTIMTGENATYDFSTWGGESNSVNSTLYREDLFEVEVSSPATADVRPYWDSDSNVGADANSWQYLRVMVWDAVDGTWESYGNANANYSGMTASNGSVVSDTDLSFSTNFVTLGFNEPVPLPVELLMFSGKIEDSKTKLTWQTATEVNNDYFEVQHSTNGDDFKTVGTVQGNGNSNEVITYNFIHPSPEVGLNYYRLKQVDFDGSVEFHEIIQLENSAGRIVNGMEVSTYPNPTDPSNLNLRVLSGDNKSSISVRVMNLSGQLFIEEEFKGTLMLDEKLAPSRRMIPGIYFMVVQQGKETQKHKIIIR